ncbi:concanavalin A-like lectin/glucanase domain-containing protein [Tribonema minus]|uniref:Concanavalin A-like lectin/glucanase domain-containing protein n=1 Tax=Tribonema minus TaxID=303371 RepID=A0A835ZHQ0_9STRA|nr:concanavalin A-like lectin/glucanase domain-containing protein [Tribonema minus]
MLCAAAAAAAAGGGGNWEFQLYQNNRTNSYVDDGVLYLQPTLTSDRIGMQGMWTLLNAPPALQCGSLDIRSAAQPPPQRVLGGYTMDMWGLTAADQCTSNAFYGCLRTSDGGGRHPINPISSAKITTAGRFSFTYGRVEVHAKVPRGDWLWPAVWLLPRDEAYGTWPASGEIDLLESRGNGGTWPASGEIKLLESRGNGANYPPGGSDTMSSCLHWGPYMGLDRFEDTFAAKKAEAGTYSDDFHTYGMVWTEEGITTYVDNEDNVVLRVPFDAPAWERGRFGAVKGTADPWTGAQSAAPFDQPFYIIMNASGGVAEIHQPFRRASALLRILSVAVGGVGGYFPEGSGKPWTNKDPDAAMKFLEAQNQWYPTWQLDSGRGSALQVKSVKVWQQADRLSYACASPEHCPALSKPAVAPPPLPPPPPQGGHANDVVPPPPLAPLPPMKDSGASAAPPQCVNDDAEALHDKVALLTGVSAALGTTVLGLLALVLKLQTGERSSSGAAYARLDRSGHGADPRREVELEGVRR